MHLRVPQHQVVGLFTCAELVDRVKQTVPANSAVLDLAEPLAPISCDWTV